MSREVLKAFMQMKFDSEKTPSPEQEAQPALQSYDKKIMQELHVRHIIWSNGKH